MVFDAQDQVLCRDLFADLIDGLEDGVVVVDGDGYITAHNRQIFSILGNGNATDFTGLHIRDAVARHFDLDFWEGDDLGQANEVVRTLLTGGYQDEVDRAVECFTLDGRKLDVRRKAVADGGGIVTVRDVTDRSQLVRRTRQLEALNEHSDEGILQVDAEGRVELFNSELTRMYGINPYSLQVGDHIAWFTKHFIDCTEIIDEMFEERPKTLEQLDKIADQRVRHRSVRTKTGRVYNVVRVTLPDGGSISLHRDVTTVYERQQLLEVAKFEAEDMSRLKSEFIARVTHELRTPMHGVLGIAALMEQSDLDETQLRFLATLRRSGLHMIDLIDGLLTTSTLETGDLLLERQPCDLDLILRDSFEMVRPKAAEKELELELKLDLDGTAIVADGTRLTQIVINLLTNAVKFTDQGTVSLIAKSMPLADRTAVVIDVQDTGCGIAEDKLADIFTKFSQIATGRGGRSEGVGLGLSIARSLTELMDGCLTVRSEEGVGTTFTLEIVFDAAGESENSLKRADGASA
ncbi:MAG: ATP-binding protein [Paracoccaceae bacterium]